MIGGWLGSTPYDPEGDKVVAYTNRGGTFWSHYAPNAVTTTIKRLPFRGDDDNINVTPGISLERITGSEQRPSQLVAITDAAGYHQGVTGGEMRIVGRHQGHTTTNLSFFDAHAESLRRVTLPSVTDGLASPIYFKMEP